MGEIFSKANLIFMLNGLGMTIVISLATAFLSVIFGTVLAMFRNYCRGKWRFLSVFASAYIELFRCTPNLLWIFLLRFTLKGNAVIISILAFTLFTSAVVAEIVRGGLNAIPKGQFEGAASQGFSFLQTMWHIILPQAFKMIIPALLSQCTTIIKDTSYLKAVDIHEFMRNSSVVLGSATGITQIIALYGFVLLTYFVLNFILSCGVRSYQKHLAVA
ncbi:MAG: amino acid ABC transporter permease [Clostridia bacterium]|nr:amino acid ABC transporter permease [Clostridia bacterium]NCD03976.1 amino acid ABC transporter permease [Clostridia bacterium]